MTPSCFSKESKEIFRRKLLANLVILPWKHWNIQVVNGKPPPTLPQLRCSLGPFLHAKAAGFIDWAHLFDELSRSKAKQRTSADTGGDLEKPNISVRKEPVKHMNKTNQMQNDPRNLQSTIRILLRFGFDISIKTVFFLKPPYLNMILCQLSHKPLLDD